MNIQVIILILEPERFSAIAVRSFAVLNLLQSAFQEKRSKPILCSRLAPFLNAWLAAPDTVILRYHFMNAHILEAADTYNPTNEAVLLLESFYQVTLFYLKNLPITPQQC